MSLDVCLYLWIHPAIKIINVSITSLASLQLIPSWVCTYGRVLRKWYSLMNFQTNTVLPCKEYPEEDDQHPRSFPSCLVLVTPHHSPCNHYPDLKKHWRVLTVFMKLYSMNSLIWLLVFNEMFVRFIPIIVSSCRKSISHCCIFLQLGNISK